MAGAGCSASPETIDAPCRRLANASGCIVVSVDYPSCPGAPLPQAARRLLQGTDYVRSARKPSASIPGGSRSAAIVPGVIWRRPSRFCADRMAPHRLSAPGLSGNRLLVQHPSYRAFGKGYGLTEAAMRWFWSQYLARPEDGMKPLASPLRADLRGLPPALVITAEFDPLRDEGEAYAGRLRTAGVRVEARRYDGQLHGFFQMGGVMNRGKQAINDAAAALRAALGSAPPAAGLREPAAPFDRAAYARYAASTPATPPAAASSSLTSRGRAASAAIAHAAKEATSGLISPTWAASTSVPC